MKIIAVVIWFKPRRSECENISLLLSQFDEVILVDNTHGEMGNVVPRYPQDERCIVVQNANRGGIARGLNIGVQVALDRRAEYVALFDQDTSPPVDFRARMEAHAASDHPNYLFPVCVDVRTGQLIKTTVVRRFWFRKVSIADENAEDARIVLTSGSVISAACFEAVGEFREEFFIDHVDTDFCIRLIRKNLRIQLCNDVVMQHALGNILSGTKAREAWKPYNYPPTRTYFRIRNATVLITENILSMPGISLFLLRAITREFIAVLLFEGQKLKKLRAFFLGWRHGLTYILAGRMPILESEESL